MQGVSINKDDGVALSESQLCALFDLFRVPDGGIPARTRLVSAEIFHRRTQPN